MQNNSGFSLLEILIVLVIISITISFAVLAYGDFGDKRRIIHAAEHFANYLKLAEHQAILESGTLGIRLNQYSYQVLRFYPDKGWHTLSRQHLFQKQYFPDKTIINLKIDKPADKNIDILIHASGDITPFRLVFYNEYQDEVVTLTGLHNGQLSLHSAKNS